MAKKLLNAAQEEWLMNNYHSKSNKELAEELSEMVRIENMKTINRLERLLPDVTYMPTRKSVEHQLEQMKSFEGFTEAYVRHVAARIGCQPKSKALISEYCRQKAHDTNIKKWIKKAAKVENIASYLRTMRVREVRICVIDSESCLNSFRNAISRFNQGEGLDSGIEIYNQYISEVKLLRLEARLNPRS